VARRSPVPSDVFGTQQQVLAHAVIIQNVMPPYNGQINLKGEVFDPSTLDAFSPTVRWKVPDNAYLVTHGMKATARSFTSSQERNSPSPHY
jgi:hypothetical protein